MDQSTMQIFYASASPFVRKVMICAYELGCADQIERLPAAAHPITRDATIVTRNPLGKVPTFVTDDGQVLYDSRVICEYLVSLEGGTRLLPQGPTRWQILCEQALADGLMDAALLARYETVMRPEEFRFRPWLEGQLDKVVSALDQMEIECPSYGSRVDLGTISTACALGYLDLRFNDLGWRTDRPKLSSWFAIFSKQPSVAATVPIV